VATAHGEIPGMKEVSLGSYQLDLNLGKRILNQCPAVDVWGMNVYRWDNPKTIFRQWENLTKMLGSDGEMPMYLSESGADSYFTDRDPNTGKFLAPVEAQQDQADANVKIYLQTRDSVLDPLNVCAGVTFMTLMDDSTKSSDFC